jgi:integrase/recombinase XerD
VSDGSAAAAVSDVIRGGVAAAPMRRLPLRQFLTADGRRLDRHGAARIVRRVARPAGIAKNVGPHTLRLAFITAALDTGVPLAACRYVTCRKQPPTPTSRTTMRYDRARTSLDRHATYIVAAYSAGAVR